MSVDDDMKRAVGLHRAGKLDEAREIYERVLSVNPDSADALHFLGLLAHQTGDSERGIELIERALEHAPGYTDAYSNLGNILKERGRLEEARACYESALACDPRRAAVHNNLGVLLRYLGDLQQSRDHLLSALTIFPKWSHAHLNLGNTYAALRHPDRAVFHYRKAIELDPALSDLYRVLGYYLYSQKQQGEALAVYQKLLEIDPGNAVAEHMLAATTGEAVPERASDAFVRALFDQFASRFDVQLERLGYRAPQMIADALALRIPSREAKLRILDLGCGTGLCGTLMRPWAERLVGVDLSPRMLEHARARGCYDELVCAELVEHLGWDRESYHVIASADTLIYFGRLDTVMERVARRLTLGGWLLFSLERDEAEDPDPGYRLLPHGRYAHQRGYLEEIVRAAGLELAGVESGVIRKELGEPVEGWLVVARKPIA